MHGVREGRKQHLCDACTPRSFPGATRWRSEVYHELYRASIAVRLAEAAQFSVNDLMIMPPAVVIERMKVDSCLRVPLRPFKRLVNAAGTSASYFAALQEMLRLRALKGINNMKTLVQCADRFSTLPQVVPLRRSHPM